MRVAGAVRQSDEPRITITTKVNGQVVTTNVPTRLHVADFLRHTVGLTGTHVGCEQGVCGMCSVLVDGCLVKSCLMFAAQLDGRSVRTVEGLEEGQSLSRLRSLFKEEHALQCGFCTPAFLMAARALDDENPPQTRGEVAEALSGVMCRCTGYAPIIQAVTRYLKEDREGDTCD